MTVNTSVTKFYNFSVQLYYFTYRTMASQNWLINIQKRMFWDTKVALYPPGEIPNTRHCVPFIQNAKRRTSSTKNLHILFDLFRNTDPPKQRTQENPSIPPNRIKSQNWRRTSVPAVGMPRMFPITHKRNCYFFSLWKLFFLFYSCHIWRITETVYLSVYLRGYI